MPISNTPNASLVTDSTFSAYRRPQNGGWIVRSRSNRLGLGKLLTLQGDQAQIEYFYGPGKTDTIFVPAESAIRTPLEPQTRCYLFAEQTQRWVMGRIKERYAADYEVDLPNGRSVFVPEPYIFVRCAGETEPMDTLLVRGHETVYFHTPRMRFVRSVLRQRAGYRGLTGLASAAIELYPHQVEVIRRVLGDPIQRYLLADEVGLGKTIEAGVIIRQHLLDDPKSEVLVIVPASLTSQWRGELARRLGLPVDRLVHVCSAEEIDEEIANTSSMVVLDEAHQLVSDAYSTSTAERARYSRIAAIAHRADKLLLLSATPAASSERQFLAMLHLLDPATYGLDDLKPFRDRIGKRQEIGRLLLTLRDNADPFALGIGLRKLEQMFPSDEVVARRCGELRSLIQSDSPAGEIGTATRRLRTHISETYRIHRRMLRNHRADWDGSLLARRAEADGSFAPMVINDTDSRVSEVHDLIDDWRAYAFDAIIANDVSGEERRGAEDSAVALLQLLLQCAATSLVQLRQLARARLDDTKESTSQIASDAQIERALSAPRFAEERKILTRILAIANRPAEETTRNRRLALFLADLRDKVGIQRPPKCVVFCPNAGVGGEVIVDLQARLGRRAVTLVTSSSQEIAEAVAHFEADRDCFVLIADAVAEEGLNLQSADYLILLDLPWSPNRLEQRLGRLDRIGRTTPVRTVVFVGPSGPMSMYEGWLEILRNGFGVFRESIAGLQFFVEDRLPSFMNSLLAEGARGLRSHVDELQDAVAAEHLRLKEQAALDEIGANTEHTSRFFTSLDDLDADGEKMRRAFEGWACDVLKLQRHSSQSREHEVEYEATRQALVPGSILKSGMASELGKRCTFHRRVAAKGRPTSLVRIGHALVDQLWDYMRWDDRGRAYAIWRHEPSFDASEGGEWLGFKLHYIIESGFEVLKGKRADSSLPEQALRALSRRADAVLPPFIEVLYFGLNAEEVADPTLLAILKRPGTRLQDGGVDTNLHKDRLEVLDTLIAPGQWEWACSAVRKASEEVLRTKTSFQSRVATALSDAQRQVEEEAAQLEARALASHRGLLTATDNSEATLHRIAGDLLLGAISKPSIRLDSVGFIVVSGRPIRRPSFGE